MLNRLFGLAVLGIMLAGIMVAVATVILTWWFSRGGSLVPSFPGGGP